MLDATITNRELNMPRILGFHEVKDVQHWLSSPKREEFFGPLGVTEIKTYIDPERSNRAAVTMNVPDMDALMAKGVDMNDYEVVGDHVVMANFEGNKRADGSVIRQQPWWDKGYLIDIFYLSYFFIGVTILIKRLPPSSWQPRHNH